MARHQGDAEACGQCPPERLRRARDVAAPPVAPPRLTSTSACCSYASRPEVLPLPASLLDQPAGGELHAPSACGYRGSAGGRAAQRQQRHRPVDSGRSCRRSAASPGRAACGDGWRSPRRRCRAPWVPRHHGRPVRSPRRRSVSPAASLGQAEGHIDNHGEMAVAMPAFCLKTLSR